MSKRLNILIERDKDGYFAYCPELEGCHTQGDSLDEIIENMKEATELYLETISDEEKREILTKEVISTSYEVHIA